MPSKEESLIEAASHGQLDTFESLLGSDPRASLQETSLSLEKFASIAAGHKNAQILHFIIGLGANISDHDIYTGVLKANSLPIYEVVVPAGFDLNYDADDMVGGPLIWATASNNLPLVTYLLENGADPNKDLQAMKFTPLGKAAKKNNVEIIKLLVRHGAQVDNSGGLILAAEDGNLEAVECLAKHGANINLIRWQDTMIYMRPAHEESALHKAVRNGHESVARFLLKNGADVNLRDAQGKTALDVAKELSSESMIELFK